MVLPYALVSPASPENAMVERNGDQDDVAEPRGRPGSGNKNTGQALRNNWGSCSTASRTDP